jgi:DNA-binding MarR family transcriptional regulator
MNDSIIKLSEAVQTFRLLDAEITATQLLVFLTVALHHPDPIAMMDLQKALAIPQSSLSRIIASLSRFDRHHNEGLNLVLAYENPMERRAKLLQLTPTGVVLSRQLSTIIS